jgi:hypothetical protein
MRKLAIIHFNPIDSYPPVMNWLNFLAARQEKDLQIRVFTMHPGGRGKPFEPGAAGIRISRFGKQGTKKGAAWLNWLAYYIRSTNALIRWRPDAVMYYETLSSFPALFYRKYIRPQSSLFIHYHEYTSIKEYGQGMVLSRWLHEREKIAYPLADWISHTNADRIRLFRDDLGNPKLALHALPNYPPDSWQAVNRERTVQGSPVKIVYVGALGLDTMYTKEFAEWVNARSGQVTWDIYTDNITPEARHYLGSFGNGLIRLREGVDYYSLPGVLTGYDIGVILYKGHIPNYIYNAPNKLFEYMDCGLDTWFPEVMTGIHPYITTRTYPKVLALDFAGPGEWDLSSLIDRSGLTYAPAGYYAEQVFPELLQNIRGKETNNEYAGKFS